MEILKQVYFDNTVAAYLGAFIALLFVLLFKRVISKYIAGFICKILHKRWPEIKKEQLVDLIIYPLNSFIVISAFIAILSALHFPSVIDFPIFGTSFHVVVQKLGLAIFIFAVVRLLSNILKFVTLVIQQHNVEQTERAQFQLIFFFKDFIRALIYIIGLIIFLKFIFEVDVRALLGGLGIAGAALALAGRESIENIIASFIIFLDKPFYTGDLVKINSYTGVVEKIGLRSTRIRTLEKTLITVPNKQMVDRVLDNLSFRTFRRTDVVLDISTFHNSDKVKELIAGLNTIILQQDGKFTDYKVYVSELKREGLTIKMELFTDPIPIGDFNQLRQDVLLSITDFMQDNGIKFSTGENQVIMQQEAGEKPPKKAAPFL